MASASPFSAQGDQREQPGSAARHPRALLRVALGLALGPLLIALLHIAPALDLRYQSGVGHVWIVTSAALVAVALALLILRVAVVRHDGRVLLLGCGFLALALLFLIHAISTPGVLFHGTGNATIFSTPLALFCCGLLLAASSSEVVARQRHLIAHWRLWLAAGMALWLLYALFMLFYLPAQAGAGSGEYGEHGAAYDAAEHAEHDDYGAAYDAAGHAEHDDYGAAYDAAGHGFISRASRAYPFFTGASMTLFLLAALVYGRRWWRSPTRPLATTTISAILLAETSLAAQLSETWQLSFWLYHVLLMAAVLVSSYGVVLGYERSGSLTSSVEGLLLGSTLQRQRDAFQRGMATLLASLERGDLAAIPTLRAELRQRFGLAEDQLDLLEHAVTVVAQEREEQRRLRALVEVSQAATLELDPDMLLQKAVLSFAQQTGASLSAVGLLAADGVHFAPQHYITHGQPANDPLVVPLSSLPAAWRNGALAGASEPLTATLDSLAGDPGPLLLAPMRHHDQTLGVLVVQPSQGQAIGERLRTVCASIAAQLATALSNARLYRELQHEHEQLQRSEQDKEQLRRMIVHDLKSPLTAIMAYLDLLPGTGLKPEQRELVDGARRSSNNMLQLISDLLDIARLEQGRLELRAEFCDVGLLLEGCANELRYWALEEHKLVSLDLEAAPAPLLLDSGLVRRVILNLYSNAIKHTPPGTAITLGVDYDDDCVRLWVSDSGPGISAERQRQLFEPFSSAGSTSRRQSNTGLGLTFCKLVAEAHGGSIVVESAVGQGTRFTVVLPLVPADLPAPG